jgi:peptidoglycan/LPS O-acetylase OafA/YrhL
VIISFELLGALALLVASAIFDLNGEQWNGWTQASRAAAVIAVVSALAIARMARRSTWRVAAAASVAAGLCLVVLALVVMAARYSDPYSGPLLWPHVLAALSLAGFVVLQGGVVAFGRGSARRRPA